MLLLYGYIYMVAALLIRLDLLISPEVVLTRQSPLPPANPIKGHCTELWSCVCCRTCPTELLLAQQSCRVKSETHPGTCVVSPRYIPGTTAVVSHGQYPAYTRTGGPGQAVHLETTRIHTLLVLANSSSSCVVPTRMLYRVLCRELQAVK